MKKIMQSTKFRFAVIFFTTIATIAYLTWRIFFTIPPFMHGWVATVCAIILLIVECIGVFESLVYYHGARKITKPEMPDIDLDLYPNVDILITTYNEEPELLQKTISGCLAMNYPDKSKVHIYVCDDGNRKEIKDLAIEMGVLYLARKERKDAKAGNLNHALSKTNSPLVANFDADMVPTPDFLMRTVPYFLQEEQAKKGGKRATVAKIGFVQTPQGFYEQDLFQYYLFCGKRTPNEQDYFYKNVQLTKNSTNSVIYGGTNAMISRKALTDIGGFSTVSLTEDFATGMLIQSKGYKCYAIDEVLANGVPPLNMENLVKQRQRWARGCIQTGKRLRVFTRKDLTTVQKLNYISSVSYWFLGIKQFIYMGFPILFSVFNIVVAKFTLVPMLIFTIPMYIMSNLALKVLSNGIRSARQTKIYETILTPFLFFPAIAESLGFSKKSFRVTEKNAKTDKFSYKLKFLLYFGVGSALTIMGIVQSCNWIISFREYGQFVTLFWLFNNLYFLMTGLFFSFGRKRYENITQLETEKPADNLLAEAADLRTEDIVPSEDEAELTEAIAADIYNKPEARRPKGRFFGVVTRLAFMAVFAGACAYYVNPICVQNLDGIIYPKMQKGINIGNALDAAKGEDWGMDVQNMYFDEIRKEGFDNVRLPVRFSDYTTEGNKIEKQFLEKIDGYIKHAISQGLTVTLDLHHFKEIMDKPECYEDKLYSMWRQLSSHYKDYPKELIFEILNEPEKELHGLLWNDYLKKVTEIIRKHNPTRLIVIGPPYYYNLYNLPSLELPKDDPYIALAFHYYEPMRFAFQGNIYHAGYANLNGITWEASEGEIKAIEKDFDLVSEFAKKHGIRKVTLNEFGVTKEVPTKYRALWTKEVAAAAERHGFSWCYWEMGSGFGIYNRSDNTWDEDMLGALIDDDY